MRRIIVLAVIFGLIAQVTAVHRLEELSRLRVQDLQEDNLVRAVQSSSTRLDAKLNKDYYIIRVGRKDKKDAYFKIKQIYERVVNILVNTKIIPDKQSLVKSKIKPQYQSKKRMWVFSTIFMVMGNAKELERVQGSLVRAGVQRLQTKPSMNFLNEKLLAMELFNSVKMKLMQKLEPFNYEIREVQEVEIQGKELHNSDLIQEQLEEEFNFSEENIQEEDIVEVNSVAASGDLEIKILFRVGPKGEELSDQEEHYDDDAKDEQESESSEDSDL